MLTTKNINSVRMLAMLGILFVHSTFNIWVPLLTEGFKNANSNNLNFNFYSSIICFFKYATIVFFIISGYLFELNRKKHKSFKSFADVKYNNLLKPYLILFFIPICLFVLFIKPYFGETFELTFVRFLKEVFSETFLTNYWFIPVLVFYFVINFFIPYKKLKIFFPISICITLFYSINIYIHLLPTIHSLSFLGFLSFFFLGRMQVYKVYKPINVKIKLLLVVVFLLISMIESHFIYYHFHQMDSWNTLRLSNIAYSISVLMLLKHLPQFAPKYLAVNTYFIYLIHPHLLRIIDYFNFHYRLSWYLPFSLILFVTSFIFVCFLTERVYAYIKLLPSFTKIQWKLF